jgi:hypothetical protein
MVFDASMTDPFPAIPDGPADQTPPEQSILDRSEQAARFLDLARHHALEPEEPIELNPLIASRLHDAIAAESEAAPAPFTLDDDDGLIRGDVFGDGNGFASGDPFGVDGTPLDPFD